MNSVCPTCGRTVDEEEIAVFRDGGIQCSYCSSSQGDTTFEDDEFSRLIHSALSEMEEGEYFNNPRPEQEQPEAPLNITMQFEQADDAIRLNEFIIDVLNILYGQYPPGTQLWTLRIISEETVNEVSEAIENVVLRRMNTTLRTPIIIEKGLSNKYWLLANLIEHVYGKRRVIWDYIGSVADKGALERRKMFYSHIWHIGSIYRRGHLATTTSPWLLGQRKPLDGDPFGDRPI